MHVKRETAGLLPQDFGARDPFEGELKSNFADKVLGNSDTLHIIKCAALSLSRCWRLLEPGCFLVRIKYLLAVNKFGMRVFSLQSLGDNGKWLR